MLKGLTVEEEKDDLLEEEISLDEEERACILNKWSEESFYSIQITKVVLKGMVSKWL